MKKYRFLILLFLAGSCQSRPHMDVETAEAKRGLFYIDIAEEGEIHSTRAVTISSPSIHWQFGMLKIVQIVEDGTEVNKSDTVIRFDPTDVQKALIDAQANLEIANAEMAKLVAEQESKIGELEADLSISELDYQINEIKLEQATFDSEIARKELQLSLDKAKIALETAGDEIENQKLIHAEEIRQKQVNILQLQKNVQAAKETLAKLTVVSPGSGIAIIRRNWMTDEKWQVGEQPWSGMPLIDLPDMRELKVEAEINEVDISKIKLDQRVEIKLDAFSDTIYTGRVMTVAGLAKFKKRESKVKVFPVEILIDTANRKLMPGMTVSCRIIVDKIDDALFIPLEGLFQKGSEEYVFARSGNSYKKRSIKTSLANNDFVIIEEGLAEGDRISLRDLSEESAN
jgi:multidrug efflux pump subunit AcrA (membrane-fusion protein)